MVLCIVVFGLQIVVFRLQGDLIYEYLHEIYFTAVVTNNTNGREVRQLIEDWAMAVRNHVIK